MDTSDNGLHHTFRGTGAGVNGLTDLKNGVVNSLFIFNYR